MSAIINDRDVWLESFLSRFGVSTVQPASGIGSLQASTTGVNIAAAKKLDLVATTQTFTTANGSTEPPVIIVSPTLRNLTGTPSYSVVSGSATLNASGTGVQVFFNSMGNKVTIKGQITDSGVTYMDQVTLVKLSSGTGVTTLLTNEYHAYLADTFGNIFNYMGGSGTFRVWDGTFEVTNACTFSVLTNTNNLLVSISNIGQYAVTGMPSNVDNATITFRAVYKTVNYDLTLTLAKLKAAAGSPADPTQYTAGGLRIPVKVSAPIGASSWSNATATSLFSSVGGPVLNDVVTEYNNSTNPPFQETRFYANNTWNLLTASIDGNLLVNGTVGADKIAAGSITADKLAIGAISVSNAPGSITGTMIADGTITTAKIAANQITAALIAANTITADKLAIGVVNSTLGQPGTITGTMIADGTITTAKIAANSITADRIAVGVIPSSTVGQPGSITGTMIANGTILTANIGANQITSALIAAGTITADRIAVGVIPSSNVGQPGSITGTMIADGTITTAKIAANQITADKISVGSLGAISANIGTVTSGFIKGNVIVGGPGYTTTNYQWPGDQGNGGSAGGFHLSPAGLLMGNPSSGRYVQITEGGNIYCPNFSIVNGSVGINGNGSFSGNVYAYDGYFAGDISASRGNISGTAYIADASILNAKIGNLQVDTIKIANSSVSNILGFGAINVDEFWAYYFDVPGDTFAAILVSFYSNTTDYFGNTLVQYVSDGGDNHVLNNSGSGSFTQLAFVPPGRYYIRMRSQGYATYHQESLTQVIILKK